MMGDGLRHQHYDAEKITDCNHMSLTGTPELREEIVAICPEKQKIAVGESYGAPCEAPCEAQCEAPCAPCRWDVNSEPVNAAFICTQRCRLM